jgi:hypothetical protein
MGSREPRLSVQGVKVLRVFLDSFDENVRTRLAGADIMKRASVSSGTLYPLLIRFEEAGILDSDWERQAPEHLGRPRRRLYRLTASGVRFSRAQLQAFMPASVRAAEGT